ncbi:GEM-like protein 5 [Triticum dicoccoides]|nr:GEM-like protein 5 [Triticum dicoccoides]XP_044383795.1 GEM-like protein 5 [Triticum aestivum]
MDDKDYATPPTAPAPQAEAGAPQHSYPPTHHAMDGKDATAPQPGPQVSYPLMEHAIDGLDATAPQPGAPPHPSSPLTQQAMEMEGKYAAPQPGTGATPPSSSPLMQQAVDGKDAAQAPPGASVPPAESARWGTRQMGPPAAPGAHPENQQAAQWTASRGDQELPPYVIMGGPEPAAAASARRTDKETKDSPMEHILDFFNVWSRKAEELSSNIWLNLKTAPSMSDAAMGKLSLGAKAITGGGFEKLYKQTFASGPDEHVKKTFACYLSTATGPVAGTLYLTNMNVAFCSDRPLSFTAPSGQTAWSYYKIMIPLAKLAAVEPVTAKESPPEKYIHIVTVDSHDFWFMGFVSYDKAVHHLGGAVSSSQHHGAAPAAAPAPAPTYE